MDVVVAEDAGFRYKGTEGCAVSGVNLAVPSGTFVLLCGKSGSGKTTLTKMINGLVPHFYEGEYEGKVTVSGLSIPDTQPYLISEKVGSVFQNPKTQFFNVDTTSEVLFGLENAGTPRAEMEERLEEVSRLCGIGDLLHRDIFHLSGGEKQKIAVASALAPDPSVFVFDEPSSSLDPASVAGIGNLMSLLKASGKTVIVAEHRIWYLLDLADVVLYTDGGRITRSFTGEEFRGLGDGEMNLLGLRSKYEVSAGAEGARGPAEKTLSAENLSFRRGKQVFSGLSFAAGKGEITAITGRNGCGKTTLTEILCGLLKPRSGSIVFNGRRMSRRMLRRECSLVMQDINRQFFGRSVMDECLLGSEADEETALSVLESLNLSDLKDRHPIALSGGQKQRLAVASSLLSGKSVLVLDEPSSGLDFCNMSDLASALKKASDAGKTVIVTTHDGELIRALDARVVEWEASCGGPHPPA